MITQKIIHEQGEEISLESKDGQGTIFFVRLPRHMPKEMQSNSERVNHGRA
ncbi:MAG: hypothetical protein GQ575_05165 [Deltaproteobacteria bacterium]|nr:hypothetical protein [Deltaproteobacteria bacterium]